MKTRESYLANGALAGCVLCFALNLSSSERSLIDWTILALAGLAVAWNLFRLGKRLYQAGGGRNIWHLLRTLLLWVVGLRSTLWLPNKGLGSWESLSGWAILVLAVAESIALHRREQASARSIVVDAPA